jgi:hypothetical protein
LTSERKTKQFLLTPAAGKRIIAQSLLFVPGILDALQNRTVVIIAGTTNGYVAEEILNKIGQNTEFSKKRFFRGITLPPEHATTNTGRIADESLFPGDVVIVKGKWEKGKTILDVVDNLQEGDIIIKGANAVNLDTMQAAIYIGHPKAGTIGAAMQAVIGRRVELYLPVGLEKRISGDISRIAQKLNSPNAHGPRYYPVFGNIITEIEALKIMTGVEAELVAAGGVGGAEGSCWLALTGTDEQLNKAEKIIRSAQDEPLFEL